MRPGLNSISTHIITGVFSLFLISIITLCDHVAKAEATAVTTAQSNSVVAHCVRP